jgi:hypothetical protein
MATIDVFVRYENRELIPHELITVVEVYGSPPLNPSLRPQNMPNQPYHFANLRAGGTSVRVEVQGFEAQDQEVTIRHPNDDRRVIFTFTRIESVRMREIIGRKMQRYRSEHNREKQEIMARRLGDDAKKKLLKESRNKWRKRVFTEDELKWIKDERKKRKERDERVYGKAGWRAGRLPSETDLRNYEDYISDLREEMRRENRIASDIRLTPDERRQARENYENAEGLLNTTYRERDIALFGQGFQDMGHEDQERLRKNWYKQRKKELKERMKRGDITKQQYKDQYRRFRNMAYGPPGLKRAGRFFGRGERNFRDWSKNWFGGDWGGHVMSVITALAMIIAGMIISQFLEGSWAGAFTMGFLMLAVSTLLPGYREVEGFDKIVLNAKPRDLMKVHKMLGHIKNNRHTGSSFIKSALKFFAVWFFVTGANNSTVIGWLSNIVVIIVAALAYFSFSTKYDPNVPGQIFESVGRFFIGFIVIPWMVFYGIFQSFVLGLMAMAFFAVPPVATKESGEGEKVMLGEYGRWIFAIIMLFALFGSGIMPIGEIIFGLPTWGLTGALRSTFLYFWLVTFIAGFFSPSSQRPAIGFIMLAAATMIYAAGPGTQQVGSALLGPWFGQTFVAVTDAMAPVTEAFNQIGNTFGMAFQMIFNPVGFAQGIMTGTYSQDPDTGLIGAYGVEVGNFRSTPIYAGLPYSIIIPIENKGSAEATDIEVMLLAGTGVAMSKQGDVVSTVQNVPKSETTYWKPVDLKIPWTDVSMKYKAPLQRDALTMTDVGITEANLRKDAQGSTVDYECFTHGDDDLNDKSCTAKLEGRTLIKQDSEQIFFSSDDTGIPCTSVVNFGLLDTKGSKFLPFTALVSYDYEVESSLAIEAISTDEWDRKAQEGTLVPGVKKPSTMKNSPAMLNIDTLEQPIREGTPLLIAFNLTPAIAGTGWVEFNENKQQKVILEVPPELAASFSRCTTEPSKNDLTTDGTLEWNHRTYPVGEHAIICYFGGIPVAPGNPTQTYYINAKADFRYNEIATKAFALQFGGTRCCRGDGDAEHLREDCIGQNVQCIANECKPGSGTTPTVVMGDPGFCATLAGGCDLGAGGCDNDDQCMGTEYWVDKAETILSELECKENVANGICCPKEAQTQQCQAAHNEWKLDKVNSGLTTLQALVEINKVMVDARV